MRLMKWRNQLLAMLCLAAFLALGVLYFKHWVVQKPFGIILFVGEGLTPGRLAMARAYAGGADGALALDAFSHVALLKNHSQDFATPDRAAAATALATGEKTNNGRISTAPDGRKLRSIMELARSRGRTTGIVTDGSITDATSAAFFAHGDGSTLAASIADELVDRASLDVILGGGLSQLLPQAKGGSRPDSRDLLLELRRTGYDIAQSKAELEAVPKWRRPRLFGGFAHAELAFSDEIESRGEQPSLSDMVRRAIELLQYNRGGYLLVVDAALMRKAAEANQGQRTLMETLEFDRAIATARRYAGTRSTIFVAGDVGVGGLALNGTPFRDDAGVALLGLNSAGKPWLTWASGPNAPREPLQPMGQNGESTEEILRGRDLDEPAAFHSDRALNTVDDVIAFGTGLSADRLHGVTDNTNLFRLIEADL